MMLHAKQFDFLRPTKKDEKLESYSQRDCGKDENNLTSDRVKNYIMSSICFSVSRVILLTYKKHFYYTTKCKCS